MAALGFGGSVGVGVGGSSSGLGPGSGIPVGPAEGELIKIVEATAPFSAGSWMPLPTGGVAGVPANVQANRLMKVASDPGFEGATADVVSEKAYHLSHLAMMRVDFYQVLDDHQDKFADLYRKVAADYEATLPPVKLPAPVLRVVSRFEQLEAMQQGAIVSKFGGGMTYVVDLTHMGLGRFYGAQAKEEAVVVIARQREAIAFPILTKATVTGTLIANNLRKATTTFKEQTQKALELADAIRPEPPGDTDPGVPGPGEPGFPWGKGGPFGDDGNGDGRDDDGRKRGRDGDNDGDGDGDDDKPPIVLPDNDWPPDWWPPRGEDPGPPPIPPPNPDPTPKPEPWHNKPGTGYDSPTLPGTGAGYGGSGYGGAGASVGGGIGGLGAAGGTGVGGASSGAGFASPPTGVSAPGTAAGTHASTGRGTGTGSGRGMGMMPGQTGGKSGDKDKKKSRNRYFPHRNEKEQKPHPLGIDVIATGPVWDKNHPLARKDVTLEDINEYMAKRYKEEQERLGYPDHDPYQGWRT